MNQTFFQTEPRQFGAKLGHVLRFGGNNVVPAFVTFVDFVKVVYWKKFVDLTCVNCVIRNGCCRV